MPDNTEPLVVKFKPLCPKPTELDMLYLAHIDLTAVAYAWGWPRPKLSAVDVRVCGGIDDLRREYGRFPPSSPSKSAS